MTAISHATINAHKESQKAEREANSMHAVSRVRAGMIITLTMDDDDDYGDTFPPTFQKKTTEAPYPMHS